MTQYVAVFAAVTGAVLNIIGLVPYLRDIFRGKTKPERAMWWIYTLLFGVLLAAQWSADARWLLLVSGVYVVSALLIAVLSVKYGFGTMRRRDWLSLCIAVAGLVLWWFTSEPLIAILIVIAIDMAGFWLTLVKTWQAPYSETLVSWRLSCAAAIISLLAITNWTLPVIVYPVYSIVGTAGIVWLIQYRRSKITEPTNVTPTQQ